MAPGEIYPSASGHCNRSARK